MRNAIPPRRGGRSAILLLALAAACGSSAEAASPGPPVAPRVTSINPVLGATSVPGNGTISANFSQAMDPASIGPGTFTVTSGPAAIPVAGTVSYADSKAVFRPTTGLLHDQTYFATITTGVRSAAGDPLGAKRTWRFSTVKEVAPCL
jgi:Bacterial Ig-like domain